MSRLLYIKSWRGPLRYRLPESPNVSAALHNFQFKEIIASIVNTGLSGPDVSGTDISPFNISLFIASYMDLCFGEDRESPSHRGDHG